MEDNKKIMIKDRDLKKIKEELNNIRLLSQDKGIKERVKKILKLLDAEEIINKDISVDSDSSLEEQIYEKMKKTSDSDLNVKLYMLYRKLQNGQVSKDEAAKLYRRYCESEYNSGYIL